MPVLSWLLASSRLHLYYFCNWCALLCVSMAEGTSSGVGPHLASYLMESLIDHHTL